MKPSVRVLFLAVGVYVVTPLGDLPALGVSLSAPLCALVMVEALAGTRGALYNRWTVLAALVWAGCLFSLAANVTAGRLLGVEQDEALLLLRFAFWLTFFVVTAAVLSQAEWADQVAAALGVGAALLAVLRIAEGARMGVWGAGNPEWLSQNSYGFGFSSFLPFVLWLAIRGRGFARAAAAAGVVLGWIALAGNGSRSSWIAAAAATVVLGGILLRAGRSRVSFAGTIAAGVLGVGLLLAAAPSVADAPVSRWESLNELARDKPFQTRLLLISKGLQLFERSPIFGVGLGRFAKEGSEVGGLRHAAWLTQEDLDRRTPHNAYIKALAETGLVGAAPLAALLMTLAWTAPAAAVRLARDGETWAAATVAGSAGMGLHLWTMSGLTGTGPWLLLGMAAAVVERDRRRRCA